MPVRVFCSYSRVDVDLKTRLVRHLAPLLDAKGVRFWSDDELTAGTKFDPVIRRELEQADLILVLMSTNYYASEYCRMEMHKAMEREDAGQAKVVTILLHAMKWDVLQISQYTVIPRNRRAVTSWVNIDEAFAEITDEIGRVIEQVEEHLRLSAETPGKTVGIQNYPATIVPVLNADEEGGVFRCVPQVDGPVAVRCTGITELLPDIVLHFYGDPGHQRISDVWLYVNTNVTSRLEGGGLTEATLSLATGHGITSLSILRHGIRAVQGAANTLGFIHVPLHELSKLPPGERNLRVANIRANASLLGMSANTPTQVVVFLRVSDTMVSPAQVTAAIVSATFQVHVSVVHPGETLSLRQTYPLNAALLGGSRTAERLTAVLTFNGRLAGYEPIGERTRLSLEFWNIPVGVSIFTTTAHVATEPADLSAVQIRSDSFGRGGPGPSIDGRVSVGDRTLELSRINLQAGNGHGVWELDGGLQEQFQEVTIGIVLAYLSDPSQNLPCLGKALVKGTLAPVSPFDTASLSSPIPRFSDGSAVHELFSIVN